MSNIYIIYLFIYLFIDSGLWTFHYIAKMWWVFWSQMDGKTVDQG